jgi:predicted nucleic acid-binding protein
MAQFDDQRLADILGSAAATPSTRRSCFDYRRRGGTRRSPQVDFYIGAHAAVRGYRLLTRDAQR